MPDADKDLIRAVSEDHYFQHLLSQQVQARADAWVAERYRVLKWVYATVLAIFGFGGLSLYGVYKDFSAKRDEVNQQLTDTRDHLKQATSDLETLRSLVARAGDSFGEQEKFMREEASRMAAASASDRQSVMAISELLRKTLDEDKQRLREDSTRLQKEISNSQTLLGKLGDASSDLQKKGEEITARQKEIEERETHINALTKALEQAKQTVAQEQEIRQRVARASNWGLVMVRSKDKRHAQIDLTNPAGAGQFRFNFHTRGIRPPMDLWVRAVETRDGKTNTVFQGDLQKLDQGDCQRIPNTPFWLRVDFIYHAKLSSDFAALRILPNEEACYGREESRASP